MSANQGLMGRAWVSGMTAGLAAAAMASVAGKRASASYAGPLNATSHVLWGERAAQQDRPSAKYTLTGFLLNQAAGIFWALPYEKWLRASRKRPALSVQPVLAAAAVAAGAYLTDYYLVPKRFTPGFEKRMPLASLALVYGALALGLAAPHLLRKNTKPARS